MVTLIADLGQLTVPSWVRDIGSFRRWSEAPDFPQHGNIWWLRGEIWADMSREQILTHIAVKTEITSVLHALAKSAGLGMILGDGLLVSNFAADISGNPDVTFVSTGTLQSDRVRLIEGAQGGFSELQGSPDLVVEVLSKGSARKDTVVLRQAYWEADIPEYWLVDARGVEPAFTILRHGARGYVAARKKAGWTRSSVLGREFRFLQARSALGHPEYHLEVR